MGVFENFPYTNFHDLNLDWILRTMKDLDKEVREYIQNNKIQFADPIVWNIQSQYPANTLVTDPENNIVYLSRQAVPTGIALANTDYWQAVFTLQALWDAVDDVMESVAPINQHSNTQAEQQMEANELFWLNHDLYIVTAQILRGQQIGSNNSKRVTIEEMLLQAQSYLTNRINTNAADIDNLKITSTNLQGQITDNNSRINSRVDNIVAQASTDNTEVVDARQEAAVLGNEVYGSLATSIQTQVTKAYKPAGAAGGYVAHLTKSFNIAPFRAKYNDRIIIICTPYFDNSSSGSPFSNNVNVAFLDSQQNLVTYYSIYQGQRDRDITITDSSAADKDMYFVSVDSTQIEDSFFCTVINASEVPGIDINAIKNNPVPVYVQGEVRYRRSSNQSIIVTLPNLAYVDSSNTGHVGYYPKFPTQMAQGYQGWTVGSAGSLNDNHDNYTVTLASGQYLVINMDTPTVATVTDTPINCIPLFGNIGGEFLNYAGNIPYDEDYTNKENDADVLVTIERSGLGYGRPETPISIKAVMKAGYNGIRLNLQFTSDGVAVLWHDPYINQNYKNVYDEAGNLVPYSDTNRISIHDSTLEDLNKYRYGDPSYPTGIPQLSQDAEVLRQTGAIIVLEQKSAYTDANINTLADILYSYGLTHNTYLACDGWTTINQIIPVIPDATYGIMTPTLNDTVVGYYEDFVKQGTKMFWWAWDSSKLSAAHAARLAKANVKFWAGDFIGLQNIINFLQKANNYYCSGVETDIPYAGTAIKNQTVNN